MGNFWQQLASGIGSSNEGGDIGLLKEPKTVLKIMVPEGAKERNDTSWFVSFKQYFPGNPKPTMKYMVHAVCLRTYGKDGTVQDTEKVVKPWVLNVSSFKQFVTLFADPEMDVYTAEGGAPITITKSGSGMDTSYYVAAGQKAFDSSGYSTDGVMTLQEAIDQLTKDKTDKTAKDDSDQIEW
jgi:hypothetical protein